MPRWTPDAQERIQQAALALFQERGYDKVTVTEITAAAGLTKRSFFNHFADKRELLFAGAAALEADLIRRLRQGEPEKAPFDATIAALSDAGSSLQPGMQYAAIRRALIAGSLDLQERELSKNASLTVVISSELQLRGVPARRATLVAHAAMDVFVLAFEDWSSSPDDDFAAHMTSVSRQLKAELTRTFDSSSA
jgi:AcrR family transcriptional regulator